MLDTTHIAAYDKNYIPSGGKRESKNESKAINTVSYRIIKLHDDWWVLDGFTKN